MSKSKTKASTVEYMPGPLLGYIFIEMTKAGITRNQVADRMIELGLYSKKTAYYFFKRDEHGRYRENVPIQDGQNLLNVVNALLIEKGCKPIPYTASWTRIEDEEVFRVYEAMRELLEHLIPLLDARSMRELAYHAWSLYENKYPERPEFFEFESHAPERHYPPAWLNWERLTPTEQDRLTKIYETAKAHAEAQVSYHAEAERLHHDAEIIAGDRYQDDTEIVPAEGWTAWEQSQEIDMTDRLAWLHEWFATCPGGEEYESERQYLKEQIDKLEAEQREAKRRN